MPWRKRTTRVIDPPVEMEHAESSHGAPSGPDMHGHRSGRSDDGDPELKGVNNLSLEGTKVILMRNCFHKMTMFEKRVLTQGPLGV